MYICVCIKHSHTYGSGSIVEETQVIVRARRPKSLQLDVFPRTVGSYNHRVLPTRVEQGQ